MLNTAQEKTLKAIDQKVQKVISDQSSDAPDDKEKRVEAKLQSAQKVHQENSLEKAQGKSESNSTEAKAPDLRSIEDKAVDGMDKVVSSAWTKLKAGLRATSWLPRALKIGPAMSTLWAGLKMGLRVTSFVPRVLGKFLARHLPGNVAEPLGGLVAISSGTFLLGGIIVCLSTPFSWGVLALCGGLGMLGQFGYELAENAAPSSSHEH